MYHIGVHSLIQRIDALFDFFGVWRNRDASIVRTIGGYLVYVTFSLGFTIGLISGAVTASSKDEFLFLGATSIHTGIVLIRNYSIRSKRDTIMSILCENCSLSVGNKRHFRAVNERLKKFLNFVVLYMVLVAAFVPFICVTPAFSQDKALPVNIGFPLNWRSNQSVYLVAYVYCTIAVLYIASGTYFNIIIWYLMIGFSIQYENLGFRLRDMGVQTTNSNKKVLTERETSFHRKLLELVQLHKRIIQNVNEFKSLFSYIFFMQIMTSAITVCGSICALTLAPHDTLFQLVVYCTQILYGIFDIFMLMYLGNDIKLTSNQLSYCVFESNWIKESKSTKKCLIILTEKLKQPHELIIYKLYPINLDTFTSISRLAYSLFNILRNTTN